ncbi:uncharacterized protein BP5553_10063 [Venustampulla echinocandica]|uniref:Uncharacterized protein n=1 Tax=Venustampulla echinocandica TaxID=2656787 RepID=A0A370TA81_9HELO|nr:uncharacterized protein BP5553_10063 [Venustampulla echinocandica]RDL30718.1 hypothetical protein BP5553_10063 [Venustampulla echinocandica]
MVSLKDVQGKVYNFRNKSECVGLGMPTLDVTNVVRNYMVLVRDIVLGKLEYIKVMTITLILKDNSDYVPISLILKKGYRSVQSSVFSFEDSGHAAVFFARR